MRTKVLFVCMGNICRSPLAEAVFLHLINERGVAERFEVDSAGTGGWHAGEPADHRMRATATTNGVTICSQARQVQPRDFERFDCIICMDEDNREILLERGAPEAKVKLLLEFIPGAPMHEVPDPYYGGQDGFELVYRLVREACAALLEALLSSQRSADAGADATDVGADATDAK